MKKALSRISIFTFILILCLSFTSLIFAETTEEDELVLMHICSHNLLFALYGQHGLLISITQTQKHGARNICMGHTSALVSVPIRKQAV